MELIRDVRATVPSLVHGVGAERVDHGGDGIPINASVAEVDLRPFRPRDEAAILCVWLSPTPW